MILTDQHIAQMRETVERWRIEGVISGINITPDALEALLDRLDSERELLKSYMAHVIDTQASDFLYDSGHCPTGRELTSDQREQLVKISSELD